MEDGIERLLIIPLNEVYLNKTCKNQIKDIIVVLSNTISQELIQILTDKYHDIIRVSEDKFNA